jgi:hypothetical protein
VNRRNLKIINFEHTLHPRLGLEINNSEFGVWKIVLLAMSCSINADNLIWEQTQNDMSKITLERERGEGRNKSSGEEQHKRTRRFVSRGSVLMNLLLVEEATKAGSIQPFPSLNRSLRSVECFFLITGHLEPARITTQLCVSCKLYKTLGRIRRRKNKATKQQEQQLKHKSPSLKSLNTFDHLTRFWNLERIEDFDCDFGVYSLLLY